MKRESGITLIEMVVTMLLTSVFVLLIGLIVVSANDWWLKACGNVALQDDMRYARRRISWLLRNADNNPFKVTGSGKSLMFNGNEKITLDKDKSGNDQVLYVRPGGEREIILTDVDSFTIYGSDELFAMGYKMLSDNILEKSVVMFSITKSMPVKNSAGSGILTNSTKFIVKNRNSGS